jgi:hypothetical protein
MYEHSALDLQKKRISLLKFSLPRTSTSLFKQSRPGGSSSLSKFVNAESRLENGREAEAFNLRTSLRMLVIFRPAYVSISMAPNRQQELSLIGIILSILYLKTRNLLAPIFCHFFYIDWPKQTSIP